MHPFFGLLILVQLSEAPVLLGIFGIGVSSQLEYGLVMMEHLSTSIILSPSLTASAEICRHVLFLSLGRSWSRRSSPQFQDKKCIVNFSLFYTQQTYLKSLGACAEYDQHHYSPQVSSCFGKANFQTKPQDPKMRFLLLVVCLTYEQTDQISPAVLDKCRRKDDVVISTEIDKLYISRSSIRAKSSLSHLDTMI